MSTSRESELLSLLREAMEERVKALSEQANHQPELAEIKQNMLDFMESVKDKDVRAALLQYESLKNDYISLIMPYLYEAGAADSLATYGLIRRLFDTR